MGDDSVSSTLLRKWLTARAPLCVGTRSLTCGNELGHALVHLRAANCPVLLLHLFGVTTNDESIRSPNPTGAALAHAPAVLQRHVDWRVSPALGASARAEGLLRDGETHGGVSWCTSELQSGPVAGRANPGLRIGGRS